MDNLAFVEFEDSGEKPKNELSKPSQTPVQVYTFDEAANLTGSGVFHYFVLIISGFSFMIIFIETSGMGMILPFLKCDLSSTEHEMGILSSAGFFGIFLSSHAMGFLADTWGRVKTLRTGILLGLITSLISAFSTNIWMLIVFRFLNGLAISGCQSCVFTYLGEFHGDATRVRNVTSLTLFFPIALIYLPGFATIILPLEFNIDLGGVLSLVPWRVFLLTNCFLSTISFCGLLILPESPKYDLVQGKTEQALRTLRTIYKWNTGRPEYEYSVKEILTDSSGSSLGNVHGVKGALVLIWNQTALLFTKKRIFHTMNFCAFMIVIFATSQSFFMWLPTMVDLMIGQSNTGNLFCEVMSMNGMVSKNKTVIGEECDAAVNTEMLKIMILVGLMFAFIYLIFIFIVDVIGKRNLLLIWMIIAATTCLIMHWISSYVVATILLAIIMATGGCGGILCTISIEYYPTNINAMGMCLLMMIGRLGAVFGSYFFRISIFSNCNALFYVYCGLLLIAGVSSTILPTRSKKKNNQIDNNVVIVNDS